MFMEGLKMIKTNEKCSFCNKILLKDSFNGRIDIACPDYFFGDIKTFNLHTHYKKGSV
jgi:phage FluMu protein Com